MFLFGETAKLPFGAKIDAFPTKDRRPLLGDALPKLNDLMARVEAARDQRLTLQAARKTSGADPICQRLSAAL